MKISILFLYALLLLSDAVGQQFISGENEAANNMYVCKITQAVNIPFLGGIHNYYTLTNVQNVLKNQHSGMLIEDLPKIESNRKLFELLYEVYGGKEKMQEMGSEKISFRFYIGMDHRVKEICITITTQEEPKTTIYQIEKIENLIKERIRFNFDSESPNYRDATYNFNISEVILISGIPEALEKDGYYSFFTGNFIELSKIPDALETGLYSSSRYRSNREIEKFYDRGEFEANNNKYICRVFNVSDYTRSLDDIRNIYRFSNVKNELFRGPIPSINTPTMKSERTLLEILYKVYGGREQMQALTDEELRIIFLVGGNGRIREMQINITTHEEPVLTIYQIESIESLLKEYLIFEVDPDDQAYRHALPAYSNRIVISEIPDILEE